MYCRYGIRCLCFKMVCIFSGCFYEPVDFCYKGMESWMQLENNINSIADLIKNEKEGDNFINFLINFI